MYFINSNEQAQATIPLGVSIERLRNKRNRILDVISNSLYKTKVDSDTRKLFNILSPLIQALSTPTHTAVGEIECLERSMIQVSAVLSKNIRKLSRTSLGKSLISQIITTMSENVINYGYPTNQTNHRRSFELHGDNTQHLMYPNALAANRNTVDKNAPLLVQSGTVIEVKREKENLTSGSRSDTFSKNDIKTENQNIEEDEDEDDDDDVTELPNTNDSEFVLIEDYESEDDSSSTSSSSASSSSSLAAECNDDNNEADNSVDEVFIENCYKNSSDNTPKSIELEFGNPNYVCHENNIFC